MSRVRADAVNREVCVQMWQCLAQNAKWSIAARLEQPGVKVMTGTGVIEGWRQ
jgi:hypothetical protein